MKELEIAQTMQNNKVQAHEAVQYRTQLAGLYAFYSQELEDILMRKPAVWMKMREGKKSDKQADQEWDATPDGLNETGLAMRLKRIEKMMSSLKSIVDNANTEYNYANK